MRIMALIAVTCAGAVAAQGQPVPWAHFFTKRLLPTPQEVKYHEETWRVAKVGEPQADAVILVGPGAPVAEVLAAEELAARIRGLGGPDVPVATDPQAARGASIAFSLGTTRTNPFNARHLEACRVQPVTQPEGYSIASYSHKQIGQGVLAVGADEVGTYWASKALQQMLESRGGEVVFHPIDVRDWPVFRLRSFKSGGQDWEALRNLGRWCPNARFNCYNLCYTTLGMDQWPAPSDDYKALVADMTQFMRARGLDCMPFVNPYYLWKEHIEVSDPADLEALVRTCSLGPAAGGRRVMLCLDDFASEQVKEGPRLYKVRSQRDIDKFGDDLAAVNVAMINHLWESLRRSFPDVALYVVLPYYWNPSGRYRSGGEEYLRKVGENLAKEVRIVWTGPQVRSLSISEEAIAYYQGLLGGRKVMLWDNTLYAHHNPPHYLFDAFTTKYPDKFAELISPEVHYNAGGGEIYYVGLLCAASYLWNPAGYNPQQALRDALAAVGGPGAVDSLLAFREAFYELWDGYMNVLGTGEQFLKTTAAAKQRWLDDPEVERLEGLVSALATALEEVRGSCANAALIAECEREAGRFLSYREALEAMRQLPPPEPASTQNLAPGGDCERSEQGKPVGWQLYVGAGRAELATSSEAHSGQACVALKVVGSHDWGDGRKSINVAAMAGETNGFDAGEAPAIEPLRVYYVRFWLRGDPLPIDVSFQGWREGRTSQDRVPVKIGLEPFTAPKEWTCYTGRFIAPADLACGALKINVTGWWTGEEPPTGTVYIDDVYVGGSQAEAAKPN